MRSIVGGILLLIGAAMPATVSAAMQAPSAIPPAWGDFGRLAGSCWKDEKELSCFDWDTPGEVMRQTNITASGTATQSYRLDPMGTAIAVSDGGALVAPRPGIVVRQYPAIRIIYRIQPQTMAIAVESLKNGVWMQTRSEERQRASSKDIAAARNGLEAARDAYRPTWGALADLAGRNYLSPKGGAVSIEWMEPGKKLAFWVRNDKGEPDWARIFEVNAKTGKIEVRTQAHNLLFKVEDAVFLPDGSFYEPNLEAAFDVGPNNELVKRAGDYSKKTGDIAVTEETVMPEAAPAAFAAFQTRNRAALAAAKAKAEANRRAEAQAKAEKKANGGGGLFGTLLGATVGAVAAGVGDLNTADTMGVIMKGASVTSANGNVASALGGMSDTLLSGSANAPAAGGVAGAAAGSYPTKPNLATGACAGFTESNYRDKALQGGGDAQLYTMCGQAFEYYTMYKRAIAQGYSEADANRTYAAHQQAAQTASGYARDWAAN